MRRTFINASNTAAFAFVKEAPAPTTSEDARKTASAICDDDTVV